MADKNQEAGNCITYGQMNLINDLRKLWLELAMWRRAYLVSYISDLEDLNAVGSRLYNAPTDIGNLLEVFFGTGIGRKIESLIREQIVIGGEILRAEKAGNREDADAATVKIYQNADDIAAYLAKINPYWEEETWKNLLYEYYETTILEIVMALAGRYEEAVTLYASLEDQALGIANYMAMGIIPYFTG